MAVKADGMQQLAPAGQHWYARSPDEVAAALNVHPGAGLTAARAAELLTANGPNAGSPPQSLAFACAVPPRPCGETTSGIGGCVLGPYHFGRTSTACRCAPFQAR